MAALTGLPTCGQRVFATRTSDPHEDDLPCLHVAVPSETVERSSRGLAKREVDVIVVGHVLGEDEALEDALDALAAEVEAALTQPTALAPAQDVRLSRVETEIEKPSGPAEGLSPLGKVTLTLTATAYSVVGDPTTAR